MKYNLIALAATPVFVLVFAGRQTDSIPQDCLHKSEWGNAIVENDCDVPAWYIYDNEPQKKSIPPGSSLSVPIYTKNHNGGGGMNIKLFKDKSTDVWAKPGQPMIQFEITPTTQVFYDFSNVNSDIGEGLNGNGEKCDGKSPWWKEGAKIKTSAGDKDIVCSPGESPCKAAYSKNNDDWATTATALSSDITLVLCLDKAQGGGQGGGQDEGQGEGQGGEQGEGQGGEHHEPSSSKAPEKTSPPQVVKQNDKVEDTTPTSSEEEQVVWETVTATASASTVVVVETAYAKVKEKRHEHIHQHVHNKINKRRHGA